MIRFYTLILFLVLCFAPFDAKAQNGEGHLSRELQELHDKCMAIEPIPARMDCLEPFFIALTKEESAMKAIEFANTMKNEGKIEDCHMVAHVVGEVNLARHDYDLGKALGTCSMACLQGCVHASVQNYIAGRIKPEDLEKELRTVCDSVEEDKMLRRQCIHGVGHGFLTRGYLSMNKAIAACEGFEVKDDANNCLSGVFMENMRKYLTGSKEELIKDIPGVCTEVLAHGNPIYSRMCFHAIGEGLMFFSGHDLGESMKICRYASDDKRMVDVCMEGAMYETGGDDYRFELMHCNNFNLPDSQELCFGFHRSLKKKPY